MVCTRRVWDCLLLGLLGGVVPSEMGGFWWFFSVLLVRCFTVRIPCFSGSASGPWAGCKLCRAWSFSQLHQHHSANFGGVGCDSQWPVSHYMYSHGWDLFQSWTSLLFLFLLLFYFNQMRIFHLFCTVAWCPHRALQICKDMCASGCTLYKGQYLFRCELQPLRSPVLQLDRKGCVSLGLWTHVVLLHQCYLTALYPVILQVPFHLVSLCTAEVTAGPPGLRPGRWTTDVSFLSDSMTWLGPGGLFLLPKLTWLLLLVQVKVPLHDLPSQVNSPQCGGRAVLLTWRRAAPQELFSQPPYDFLAQALTKVLRDCPLIAIPICWSSSPNRSWTRMKYRSVFVCKELAYLAKEVSFT